MMDAADAAAEKLIELQQAQKQLDEDVSVRLLRVEGYTQQADLLALKINQERELADAMEEGLDVTKLLQVQTLEYADAVAKATEAVSEAAQSMIELQKKALLDSISTTTSILSALKGLLATGALSSPGDVYRQAQASFAQADMGNVVERGNALLAASKNAAATSEQYRADYATVVGTMARFAEVAPTISFVEQQIELLKEISKAVSEGNNDVVQALGVTFNAAQIDMGTANNSLSAAFSAIQNTLNYPIYEGTAKSNIILAINGLQAALNNNDQPITGSAADSVKNSMNILQLAFNGTISADTARTAIISSYNTVQGALNGSISGTAAATAIATQSAVVQRALNGSISGTQATDMINQQASVVQSALDGAITGSTAERIIKEQYDSVTGTLSGGMDGALTLVSTSLNSFFNAIVTAANTASAALLEATTTIPGTTNPVSIYQVIATGTGSDPLNPERLIKYYTWQNTLSGEIRALPVNEIPSFAVGSPYISSDMTANIHQGEMIIDRQSADIMRRYGIKATGAADNKEVAEETRAMRNELNLLRAELRAVVRNTAETTKQLTRWDGDGMPETRSVAA
jgi:hypothetical protein